MAVMGILGAGSSEAGEIGHYVPGMANIRDTVVPASGFYTVDYNYWYSTTQLNDRFGKSVTSVTIGPDPGIPVDVKIDVNLYANLPMFIWVSDWTILGAKYAAYIAPSFANASVGAALSILGGSGIQANTSHFDMGDLLVQPLWLGWSMPNWDFALGYGFYAPVGRYSTRILALPIGGPIKVDSTDNIGLGFWTHQFQGAIAWYPSPERGTAVTATLTYEIHGQKEGFDLTPGQDLSLNWGASQYVPVNKDNTLLLEIGPAGYCSWQLTSDSGSDARNPNVHDSVCAAGGQIGLSYLPWMLTVNLRGYGEFSAVDRFQGTAFGLSIGKKIF